MQQVSAYKFKSKLFQLQGWGIVSDTDDDDIVKQLQRENGDGDERWIVVDVTDIENIILLIKKEGRKKPIYLIELTTNSGGIITLCEESFDDVLNFWISATEVTIVKNDEPKTET